MISFVVQTVFQIFLCRTYVRPDLHHIGHLDRRVKNICFKAWLIKPKLDIAASHHPWRSISKYFLKLSWLQKNNWNGSWLGNIQSWDAPKTSQTKNQKHISSLTFTLLHCFRFLTNIFLVQFWRLETSSRRFYDFSKMTR